jgi:hypothetical protein
VRESDAALREGLARVLLLEWCYLAGLGWMLLEWVLLAAAFLLQIPLG